MPSFGAATGYDATGALMDLDLGEKLLRVGTAAMHHFASLAVTVRPPLGRSEPAWITVISTFVVEVRQTWFLVTAGHIIEGMRQGVREGYRYSKFNLSDGWARDAVHRQAIPFPDDLDAWVSIHEEGVDYAALPLPELIVANLKANRMVAIDEVHWSEQPQYGFDGLVLIGVPSASVSSEPTAPGKSVLTQGLTIIPLDEVADPPESLQTEFTRIYGRIPVSPHDVIWRQMAGDIDGMSGGPILGVKFVEGGSKYWVIGVQSGWDRPSKTIAGCYLPQFLRLLATAFE